MQVRIARDVTRDRPGDHDSKGGFRIAMNTILTVLGGVLGVVVPGLFAYALNQGVARSPLSDAQKAAFRRTINGVTAAWTAAVWGLSLAGLISYHAGDSWPRIALPLFIPVIAAISLMRYPAARTVIDRTPVATLAGVQAFRLAGFVFLIIPGLGLLPPAFVVGGYGDLATGLLAAVAGVQLAKRANGASVSFALFSLVGLVDLLNVAGLLFYYYPSWSPAAPSSAALADFSLVMVPALAAPMALILHLYAIKNFALNKAAGLTEGPSAGSTLDRTLTTPGGCSATA
jgi:hypothetical protein